MDRILRTDRKAYVTFVGDLWRKGMIDSTLSPADFCYPFFVAKKDGNLRLVWDCRETNRRFKAPPPCRMGSGGAWKRLKKPSSFARSSAASGRGDAAQGDSDLFFSQAWM